MNLVYQVAMFAFLSFFVGNLSAFSAADPWDQFYEKRRQAVRARSEQNGKDMVDPKLRAQTKKEILAEVAKRKGKLKSSSNAKSGTAAVTTSQPAKKSGYTKNAVSVPTSSSPQSIQVDKTKIPTEMSFPAKK